jgi:hypothetical protein
MWQYQMGQTSLATMKFYMKGKSDGCHEDSMFAMMAI